MMGIGNRHPAKYPEDESLFDLRRTGQKVMCHSSRPFCTRHVPGFGLVGRTPGPSKMLSRRDGLLGCQARVRRAPLYACGWIRLRMLAHA